MNAGGFRRALAIAARSASPLEALNTPLRATTMGTQKALARYTPRKVPERMQDLVSNSEVRRRMDAAIEEGRSLKADRWYDTAPLLAAFIKELGPTEGKAAFNRYADIVGLTSPGTSVPENLRRASWVYGLDRRGEALPAYAPSPYGVMTEKTQRGLLDSYFSGKGFPLTAAKTASFAQNVRGNQTPVSLDRHALRLPAIFSGDKRFLENSVQVADDSPKGMTRINPRKLVDAGLMNFADAFEQPAYWSARPHPTEYAALEQYYSDLAERHGLTPAQAQAAAWVGGADITDVRDARPLLQAFKDRLGVTARERQISEEDALSRMIRGEQPLLSVAGALGGAGALGAVQNERRSRRA